MNLNQLQNNFYKWLNKQYKIGTVEDVYHHNTPYIQTPFCNFLGDNFNIYVTKKNNKLILDDDGETINNFTSLDIKPFANHRKIIINKILRKYNVKLVDNDMLSISGEISNFPKMELNLTKAMIKLDAYIHISTSQK